MVVAVIGKSFELSVIVSYSFSSSVAERKPKQTSVATVVAVSFLGLKILDCSEFIIVKNIMHYSIRFEMNLKVHLPMC